MMEPTEVILNEYSSTSDSDLDEDSISTIGESMSSSDYSAYDIEKLVTNNDPILSISKKLSLEEVDIW